MCNNEIQMNNASAVMQIMCDCGFSDVGIVGSGDIKIIGRDEKAHFITHGAKSVVVGILPYYRKGKPCNLARFASLKDYHITVMDALTSATEKLSSKFPGNTFITYCDNSPIDEVSAAVCAGLGFRGRNNLLISHKNGTFVHIGEIITDLECSTTAKKIAPDFSGCVGCGACVSACPGGALNEKGFKKSQCLSFITQKKGELKVNEAELLKKGQYAWGCDICQNVCRYNSGISAAYGEPLLPLGLSSLDIEGLSDREYRSKYSESAFAWRGKATMLRNLKLRNE